MTEATKELIAELREYTVALRASVHVHHTGADLIDQAADALDARQPTEGDDALVIAALNAYEPNAATPNIEDWGEKYAARMRRVIEVVSRAAVPDAATELERDGLSRALNAAIASRDDWASRVGELAQITQQRDAALTAVERVRTEATAMLWASKERSAPAFEAFADAMGKRILAALDGALESEWEREYRRVKLDGTPVFNAVFESVPLLDDLYTAEYRTVSPWLPIKKEQGNEA